MSRPAGLSVSGRWSDCEDPSFNLLLLAQRGFVIHHKGCGALTHGRYHGSPRPDQGLVQRNAPVVACCTEKVEAAYYHDSTTMW